MTTSLSDIQAYAIKLLEAQMRLVEEEQAKTHGLDNSLVAMSANLARSVAAVTSEMRKREAHAKRMVGDMTDDERQSLVQAYISTLNKARRDELLKYIKGLD
jgi:hypothetical protein